MDHNREYRRWLERVRDGELLGELSAMDEAGVEDAFYRDLTFGTGGLRGIIGAGTNRMNVYVVGKASQGLADHLRAAFDRPSVVIGYDSRIKSDAFARVTAAVLAENGVEVHIWPRLMPVPSVSFAIRCLGASAGVMITASHNPSRYNGYKVYGADGCQITSAAAKAILARIDALDIFDDVPAASFEAGLASGRIKYIDDAVLTAYIEAEKAQSVLFGDAVRRDVVIVYSPLNGTGLIPVTRALTESGFTNITVVEEQKYPDGDFPTCPYPNPEVREAMALGLEYAARCDADLLLATDPDADRCGIAVKAPNGQYRLLSANEVGLLLDYICAQRAAHGRMPANPVFAKTIVTMELAEKIAAHYGVQTVNVLTGFKYIGEVIGRLEAEGRAEDFIFAFEESYGYLNGAYVRDKDGVNAAFMICEMFAFYRTRGQSLLDRLNALYAAHGYCMNTLHSYEFPGSAGMERMRGIMRDFRAGLDAIGGERVLRADDYSLGLNGLPRSDVMKFYIEHGSLVVRPSGTEPKLKAYISVIAGDEAQAAPIEARIAAALEQKLFMGK